MPALIVPHVQTNSLIIQAEPEEYAEIMNILEQIDVKRRQVFLEAALVQVTSNSALNYTIELLAGEPDDYATRLLFESSFGLSGLDFATWDRIPPATLPQGALMAVMNRGKFPALVRFFKTNQDTEVLATPFILADDNQSNTIDIIETKFVPNTATGPSQVTTTSQEGEDAGIILEITPTISSQSAVFLELSLEVSDFAQTGGSETVLPPKTTNSITSAVTIPDGEIFVIGGLTRELKARSVSKVPIVGDIPVIGKLFRSESSAKSASNLYIFLRAHVLTHPEFSDGVALTEDALDFVHDFAPGLNPVRFQKPNVSRPSPPKRDPYEPTRFKTRSPFSEGYEAPQGPYQSQEEGEKGPEAPAERYRDDVESPLRGESTGAEKAPSAPVPRTVKNGTRTKPATASTTASPPRAELGTDKAVKAAPPEGGLEAPPAEPAEKAPPSIDEKEPPAEEASDASVESSLQKAGLELETPGQSWLVPARPTGAPPPARARADSRGSPPSADRGESWLGSERK